MNISNKLTLFRLILIIPIVVLLLMRHYYILYGVYNIINYAVLFLFVTATITDYYDGKIARERNQITDFGKLFDPFADKLLVLSILLIYISQGLVSTTLVIILVARELFVQSYRALISSKGTVIAADSLGKYKTVSQFVMIAISLLFNTGLVINNILIVPSVALSLVSAFDYISSNPISKE